MIRYKNRRVEIQLHSIRTLARGKLQKSSSVAPISTFLLEPWLKGLMSKNWRTGQ